MTIGSSNNGRSSEMQRYHEQHLNITAINIRKKQESLNHVQTQFLRNSNTPTWRCIVNGAYLKVGA